MLMNTEKKNEALEDAALGGDNAAAEEREESLVLVFKKPYKFEGVEYTELDLSGLEDVTAADLTAVGKLVAKQGTVTPMPEMTMEYTLAMAARVAKLPAEFFNRLPGRETIRLKNIVTGFLYGGDGDS